MRTVIVLLGALSISFTAHADRRYVLQRKNFQLVPKTERRFLVEVPSQGPCIEVRSSYAFAQKIDEKIFRRLRVRQVVNPVNEDEEEIVSATLLSDVSKGAYFPLVYQLPKKTFFGSAVALSVEGTETLGSWLDAIYEKSPSAEGIEAIVRVIDCPALPQAPAPRPR